MSAVTDPLKQLADYKKRQRQEKKRQRKKKYYKQEFDVNHFKPITKNGKGKL